MTEPSGGSMEAHRRPVVVPAVALTALTAVGITALLGGLGEAQVQPDPLSPGAVLDQGLYETKFVESRVTVQKGEGSWDEDKRFVDMVFDVTNKGDETLQVGSPPDKIEQAYLSTSFAGSLVKITPAFGKDSVAAYALSKGGETEQLQPGVPSRVLVRYELEKNEQPPKQITLDVASFAEEQEFNNDLLAWQMVATESGERGYLPEIKARVTLPVKKGATG
ncbi:hypothetical protein ITP53_13750 [Nonomuraea sp. K274]|uniref:DUF4352 domain-containing protein n=1 Tax=Nonomuraea cypriaca TaxID=1187855 RepID=A0A931F042_9ACTN|nr:hypothetical protein [Nonomuraea cypriaca]MBF8186786.1 hypothetical protein [Nonomuraea cypriaca]